MSSPARATGPPSRPRAFLPVVAILLVAAFGACVSRDRGDGTRRMVERLREITDRANPDDNAYMNGARATALAEKIRDEKTPDIGDLRKLAFESLNAGRTEDAIATLDRLQGLADARHLPENSGIRLELLMQRAIAQLRLAEQSNCLMHHNVRSCLFPISGTGVHQDQKGGRAAVDLLSALLTVDPDNLSARWLLNIAYMTLGRYPDDVPARWLLSPDLFRSEEDIGRFPDVAAGAGLDVDDISGGVIVDDFDNDGYYDVMTSAMGLHSQLRFFHDNADGTFTERTHEAGLDGLVGGLNTTQADYDNDGFVDVLVLRGGWMGVGGRYPNSLLHNNGDGTFTDVTEAAGMLTRHPTQTATWLDYDGDGWIDLFIGNESSTGQFPDPSELFHNNGDGTFTDCAAAAGVDIAAFVKAVTSADYDGDGRPDIYVSIRGETNRLFHNDGPAAGTAGDEDAKDAAGAPKDAAQPAADSRAMTRGPARRGCGWRFSDVAAAAGVTAPVMSFPTWFFDYDNDGREDLFVSGYYVRNVGDVAADYLGLPSGGETPRLYHNNGDGTFADVTHAMHVDRVLLSMGSNYGDLDNDGWLDFYVGTGTPELEMLVPNRMFRNAGGRVFHDVTTSGGFGHLQKGHGTAFADIDADGDQDVYMVLGGAFEGDHFPSALFENPGHGNHFLVLRLEGVRSNRSAIGAVIRVVVGTPEGERSIYKTVRIGGSFGGSPLTQEIGLGDATSVTRAEIRWPGGATQVITGLEPDHRYHVREDSDRPEPFVLHPFRIGGARVAPPR